MIELVRQPIGRAQEIDRLADGPVFGRNHHLALHQAAGRAFGIGHGGLDGDPVGVFQRVQDHVLLRLFQVFQNIDDIVGFQLAYRFGQHVARQEIDHLFADRVVDFRQDFAVDPARP